MKRLLPLSLAIASALSAPLQAQADAMAEPTEAVAASKAAALRLEVIDPYVEMHSGPGRGYPVFHVIEQGETVEVLTRRPDWYEIRSNTGRVGWTTAKELSRTLQPTGVPVDLPTVSHGDYLKNSWRFGFTAGQFSDGELDGNDNISVMLGYRPLNWLGVEGEVGKTYSSDYSGEYYSANVLFEPLSHLKFSPFLIYGYGEMSMDSQPQLVQWEIDDSNYQNYGIGANLYLGRNFVMRTEYRWYEVDTDDETVRLQEWKLGFSTFF